MVQQQALNCKDWCWSWKSNTLATWCEELIHWKRLWCWERLKAGGQGDDRGWDGWMASLTGRTWVWANSKSWWCCSPWGYKESDVTERLTLSLSRQYARKETNNLLFLFWHDRYALVININVLVNSKGNQSWIFTGRTDAEAEAPILLPPDEKSLLTGKDRDAGKDWRQEEKGMTEDEMAGWHHRLNGHEFELDMTEPLNNEQQQY